MAIVSPIASLSTKDTDPIFLLLMERLLPWAVVEWFSVAETSIFTAKTSAPVSSVELLSIVPITSALRVCPVPVSFFFLKINKTQLCKCRHPVFC